MQFSTANWAFVFVEKRGGGVGQDIHGGLGCEAQSPNILKHEDLNFRNFDPHFENYHKRFILKLQHNIPAMLKVKLNHPRQALTNHEG